MTIPSDILLREIMLYEGFRQRAGTNRLGMPCIGYGFPLWEEGLSMLHGNSRLAKLLKEYLPKEGENISSAVRRFGFFPYEITEREAAALLEKSLLFYFDALSAEQAGFRHLANQCGNACVFPQSSLALYGERLDGDTAEKTHSSVHLPVHPAYFYEYTSSGGGRKAKKKQKSLPLSEQERALLRVDSVLFLTHLFGLEIMRRMHGFFAALHAENYGEAASFLLEQAVSAKLGTAVSLLARRIKSGDLDLRDAAVWKSGQEAFFCTQSKSGFGACHAR